jgi:hypothetical protein
MTCSICGEERELPHETPNDPPFFPAGDGNRHCEECERWLLGLDNEITPARIEDD